MQLLRQTSCRQDGHTSSAATDLRGPSGAPVAIRPPVRGVFPPLAAPTKPCALRGDTIPFLVPLPLCWLADSIPRRRRAVFGRFPRPLEVVPPPAGEGRQTQGAGRLREQAASADKRQHDDLTERLGYQQQSTGQPQHLLLGLDCR